MTEKLEEYRATTAKQVILADSQRLIWASHLAECELGPMPIESKALKEYIARHNELARKIFSRLN